MELYRSLSECFWNEAVWLPPNTTWADRISTPENQFPNFMDLWTYPFLVATVFIILRYHILNPFVFGPVANYVGFKNVRPKSVVPDASLEIIFSKYRTKVPEEVLVATAMDVNWSERKVERWLRARMAMNRINKYTKFVECAWQFTYYCLAFSFGLYVLSDKPWLYDISICWIGYPHKLDGDIWCYYMFSLGFYWSMTITHFFETRRKDFYQMFFHHLLTIALIVFSFTCNFVRVGSLILIVHDIADIPLQMSKMLIYLEWKRLCDAVFAFFSVVWIITRCGVYPFWIVYDTLFNATQYVEMHPVYYIFNGLLFALAVLHYFWTYFILRIIVNTAVKGKVEDDRSSSDDQLLDGDVDNDVLKDS